MKRLLSVGYAFRVKNRRDCEGGALHYGGASGGGIHGEIATIEVAHQMSDYCYYNVKIGAIEGFMIHEKDIIHPDDVLSRTSKEITVGTTIMVKAGSSGESSENLRCGGILPFRHRAVIEMIRSESTYYIKDGDGHSSFAIHRNDFILDDSEEEVVKPILNEIEIQKIRNHLNEKFIGGTQYDCSHDLDSKTSSGRCVVQEGDIDIFKIDTNDCVRFVDVLDGGEIARYYPESGEYVYSTITRGEETEPEPEKELMLSASEINEYTDRINDRFPEGTMFTSLSHGVPKALKSNGRATPRGTNIFKGDSRRICFYSGPIEAFIAYYSESQGFKMAEVSESTIRCDAPIKQTNIDPDLIVTMVEV